jgi:hypothetical protein
MRCTTVTRWLRGVVLPLAAGLAASMPGAAAARGGGGTGTFHGGFVPGSAMMAPRGAVGLSGFVVRGGGFRHGVVPRSGKVILVPRARRAPRFGTMGVLPLRGGVVPPFTGTVVPPFIGTAAPVLVGPGVGAAEIWRWDGAAWRLGPMLAPVRVWWRDQDGRWHAEATD